MAHFDRHDRCLNFCQELGEEKKENGKTGPQQETKLCMVKKGIPSGKKFKIATSADGDYEDYNGDDYNNEDDIQDVIMTCSSVKARFSFTSRSQTITKVFRQPISLDFSIFFKVLLHKLESKI